MNSNPKVTILTIVYNGERYIREAVDSILNQSYKDFEYVIVDNNSTDGTSGILEAYAQRDKRIKIIKEKEQGVLFARNAGLKFAKGEWVAILDADDVAMPNRIEVQLDYVESNPAVILVGSACTMIDEFGGYMKDYYYPATHDLLVNHLEKHRRFFPHSAAFFNKDTVLKSGGYRFIHAEDYDLWLRLSMEGEMACIHEPLVKLRRYVSSRSYTVSQRSYILSKVIPLVCYLQRKSGLPDPANLGEKEWKNFLEWAEKRMDTLNYFQKGEAMRMLYAIRYSKSSGRLSRYFQILRQILSNRFTIAALLEPAYLTNIAERLNEESKTISKTC